MKLRHLAAAVGAAALLAVGLAAPAFAADRLPVDIKAEKACGTVTLTFANPTATQHGFRWNAVAGDVATADGARTGLVTVAPGATVKETIRFDEDEFSGSAAVTLAYAFGQDSDIQPTFPGVYPVDTDCDGKPPVTVTYPADCEIGAGVDNGESGTQADKDAPCVSKSAGYERDEVGKPCDIASGEPGRGDGVVTEALKCEVPPADGDDQGENPGNENPDGDNPGNGDGNENPGNGSTEDPADLDCEDFPLADGRTAQQVLDADPSDPNVLDVDSDGTACEADDSNVDSQPDGDFTQVGADELPVAINTGLTA